MNIEDIEFGKWYKCSEPREFTGQYFGESPSGVLLKKYDNNYIVVPHSDIISKEKQEGGWFRVKFFGKPYESAGYALAASEGTVWFSENTPFNKERIHSVRRVAIEHVVCMSEPPVGKIQDVILEVSNDNS